MAPEQTHEISQPRHAGWRIAAAVGLTLTPPAIIAGEAFADSGVPAKAPVVRVEVDCSIGPDQFGNPISICDSTAPPASVYIPPASTGNTSPVNTEPKPRATTTTVDPDRDDDGYLPETGDPAVQDFLDESPGIGDEGVVVADEMGINVDPITEEGARNRQIAKSVDPKDWSTVIDNFANYGIVVMTPTTTTSTTESVTTTTEQATTTAASTSTSVLAVATTVEKTTVQETAPETTELVVLPASDGSEPNKGSGNFVAEGVVATIVISGLVFVIVRRRRHNNDPKSSGSVPAGI